MINLAENLEIISMFRWILAIFRLLVSVALTLIFLFLILFTFSIGLPLKVRHFLLKYWAKSICVTSGFAIESDLKPFPKGVLVLPNHRSWIDIPLILGIIPATIISKKGDQLLAFNRLGVFSY